MPVVIFLPTNQKKHYFALHSSKKLLPLHQKQKTSEKYEKVRFNDVVFSVGAKCIGREHCSWFG